MKAIYYIKIQAIRRAYSDKTILPFAPSSLWSLVKFSVDVLVGETSSGVDEAEWAWDVSVSAVLVVASGSIEAEISVLSFVTPGLKRESFVTKLVISVTQTTLTQNQHWIKYFEQLTVPMLHQYVHLNDGLVL